MVFPSDQNPESAAPDKDDDIISMIRDKVAAAQKLHRLFVPQCPQHFKEAIRTSPELIHAALAPLYECGSIPSDWPPLRLRKNDQLVQATDFPTAVLLLALATSEWEGENRLSRVPKSFQEVEDYMWVIDEDVVLVPAFNDEDKTCSLKVMADLTSEIVKDSLDILHKEQWWVDSAAYSGVQLAAALALIFEHMRLATRTHCSPEQVDKIGEDIRAAVGERMCDDLPAFRLRAIKEVGHQWLCQSPGFAVIRCVVAHDSETGPQMSMCAVVGRIDEIMHRPTIKEIAMKACGIEESDTVLVYTENDDAFDPFDARPDWAQLTPAHWLASPAANERLLRSKTFSAAAEA